MFSYACHALGTSDACHTTFFIPIPNHVHHLWVGNPIVGERLASIPLIQSIILSDQSQADILLVPWVRT